MNNCLPKTYLSISKEISNLFCTSHVKYKILFVLLSEIIEISSLNENSSSLKKHNSEIKKIVIKRRQLDLNYQIILTQ